ncbi:MAG TPA: imidazole glycerol phosphate synthase subunit HisF, partial [Deltaproteobacteria bacterium]|nr:imidazole glycerol phosphate synthase subunit HisF [Deltaproteobacteria bacterium]
MTALAEQFGRQCTVVAIDARRRSDDWEVVVRSGKEGTGRSVVDWAREVEDRGAGEI